MKLDINATSTVNTSNANLLFMLEVLNHTKNHAAEMAEYIDKASVQKAGLPESIKVAVETRDSHRATHARCESVQADIVAALSL